MTWCRSSELDKLWQPHFRKQFRQVPCLRISSQTYSSDNAHCLSDCNQCLLLVTRNNHHLHQPDVSVNHLNNVVYRQLVIAVPAKCACCIQLTSCVLATPSTVSVVIKSSQLMASLGYLLELLVVVQRQMHTYLLTPWSRVLLEKPTSKLCS
jgi:hypothetical protein